MNRELPVIQSNDACCREVREPAVLPEPDRERLLATFKALADGTRLDVFRLIAAQAEPICACDVVDRFDVSQPTIAHHLKVLRQAGLITSTKRGIWAYYAVDPAGERELSTVMQMLGLEQALVLR
jgi:ArsR family transcriptional regulator